VKKSRTIEPFNTVVRVVSHVIYGRMQVSVVGIGRPME